MLIFISSSYTKLCCHHREACSGEKGRSCVSGEEERRGGGGGERSGGRADCSQDVIDEKRIKKHKGCLCTYAITGGRTYPLQRGRLTGQRSLVTWQGWLCQAGVLSKAGQCYTGNYLKSFCKGSKRMGMNEEDVDERRET